MARVQIPAKFLALSSLQLIPQACDRYFNETQRPANWVCRQQNSHSHVRSENQKEWRERERDQNGIRSHM